MTTAPWPSAAPDYTSLAAAVQGEAARWNVPGMTAAVLHDGQRSRAAAGIRNLNHPAPVTLDTRFQIGSISKVFTATAIMALVERGTLDLDAPITTWVPDLPLTNPAGVDGLTLRHLLNHTTGFEGDVFFDTGEGDDALTAGIAKFGELPQWTTPGTVLAYCNTGFYLAGRVVEIATGQTFETAVTELVLEPLGLADSCYPSADLVNHPTASGHTFKERADGYKVYPRWALPRVVNAAGGIVSTVDDLLTFAAMHLADGRHGDTAVLSADGAREMRRRTSRSGVLERGFGVGWNVNTVDGVDQVGHGGATNGFRATLLTVPERGFALAMLTNGEPGGAAMEEVQAWALRHWLDIDTPHREITAPDPEAMASLAGRYLRHDARTDIHVQSDRLHLSRSVIEHDHQFTEERHETDPPLVYEAHPTGEGVYRVVEGPLKNMLIEFFTTPLFDDTGALVDTPVMRNGGRIVRHVGPIPPD